MLAVAVSVTSALAGRTRVKILFNTANAVVGAGLATAVFWALGGSQFPVDWHSGIAVTVAVLVYSGWTQLGVSCVIAAATGQRLRDVYLPALPLRVLTALGNIALGLFFVIEINRVPVDAFVVLPIFAALLVLAYRGYVRALDERDLWQQLESATKALQQLDEERVIDAAAHRAPALFRVEAAEVEVFGKRRGDVSMSSRRFIGDGEFGFPGAGDTPAWSDDGVLTVHRLPDEPYLLATAPLPSMAGVSGVLRLWSSQPAPFLRRDQRLVGTYTQAVSSALLNARLYREVVEQASLKSFEAEHDALTGLANRALLLRRADEAISFDRRTGGMSALVLLDLDHFKHVNDTLGHAAGDALLRSVGDRLPPLLRHDDIVARLGGDEFAVLLRDVESPASAMRRTVSLLRTISEPITVGALEIAVHASAGIAMHPDDAADVDTLLQRADVAMYHAKRNRGTAHQYDSSLEGNAGFAWLAMGAELRQALDRDELQVYFQPQVDLITHRVAGFEALVRWQHPQRGLVGPNEFIPVAEQSGLVGELTMRVLNLACAQAVLWPVGRRHRAECRRQPVGPLVARPWPRRRDRGGARCARSRPAAAQARDHRDHDAGRGPPRGRRPRPVARPRGADRRRRLRYGLLVVDLPAAGAGQRAQDRPVLRGGHAGLPARRGDRTGHGRPCAVVRAAHRGRGRRVTGCGPPARGARRRPRPGLLVRQARTVRDRPVDGRRRPPA